MANPSNPSLSGGIVPPMGAAPAPPAPVIPNTSLANAEAPHDQKTVRFKRWQTVGATAYMRGQEAGFSPREAEQLVRRGVAVIVHDRAAMVSDPPMVRK